MKTRSSRSDPLSGFSDFVDSVRNAWRIPGVGVAVVQDSTVLFTRGFGWRDAERKLPVTTRSIFPLGSTTKSFTALALAMLSEDGALGLDSPVEGAIKDFRLHDDRATKQATIRDFLSHRTGLPSHYDMLWLLRPMSRRELFARLRYLEPNAGLRERFQYSNVGYAAAGAILERLSGQSWEEFLAKRIFKPLGMARSGFVKPVERPKSDRALPYRHASGVTSRVPFSGAVTFENVSLIGPAGSVSSTLEDMAKWVAFLLDGGCVDDRQLVARPALEGLFARRVELNDSCFRVLLQAEAYGLGWAVAKYRGHRVVTHGGNIEGFSSLVSLMPRINAGVVVLSNTINLVGDAIGRNAYDRLLGLKPKHWNEQLRELYAAVEQGQREASYLPPSDAHSPPSLPLESYMGTYQHSAFGLVHVTMAGKALAIRFESGVGAVLHHVSSDRFKGLIGEFYLPSVEVHFRLREVDAVEGFSLILQPCAPGVDFKRIAQKYTCQYDLRRASSRLRLLGDST